METLSGVDKESLIYALWLTLDLLVYFDQIEPIHDRKDIFKKKVISMGIEDILETLKYDDIDLIEDLAERTFNLLHCA